MTWDGDTPFSEVRLSPSGGFIIPGHTITFNRANAGSFYSEPRTGELFKATVHGGIGRARFNGPSKHVILCFHRLANMLHWLRQKRGSSFIRAHAELDHGVRI